MNPSEGFPVAGHTTINWNIYILKSIQYEKKLYFRIHDAGTPLYRRESICQRRAYV